jgi:hypothetical protein
LDKIQILKIPKKILKIPKGIKKCSLGEPKTKRQRICHSEAVCYGHGQIPGGAGKMENSQEVYIVTIENQGQEKTRAGQEEEKGAAGDFL